jgi:hypothetical protein
VCRCLIGFLKGAKNKLEVKGIGKGGLAAIKTHLDDTAVMFGGFRLFGVDERGGVVR